MIFDADGTLFDYQRAEAWALRTTFDDLKLPYRDELASLYRAINLSIWAERENGEVSSAEMRIERFVRLFAAGGVNADPLLFSPAYLANLARGSQLLEGAEQVVKTLHGSGRVRLALATNGLHEVQRPRIEQSAIGACFSAVAVSDELDVAKPDRRFFDAVFALMGQPLRETVLMVGDDLTLDIGGGSSYGLDTCWFNPEARSADGGVRPRYEIADLESLLAIVLGSARSEPAPL